MLHSLSRGKSTGAGEIGFTGLALGGNGAGNRERGVRTDRPVTSQTLVQRFCSLKFLHAQHLGARSQPERSERSDQGLHLFQRTRKGTISLVLDTECVQV